MIPREALTDPLAYDMHQLSWSKRCRHVVLLVIFTAATDRESHTGNFDQEQIHIPASQYNSQLDQWALKLLEPLMKLEDICPCKGLKQVRVEKGSLLKFANAATEGSWFCNLSRLKQLKSLWGQRGQLIAWHSKAEKGQGVLGVLIHTQRFLLCGLFVLFMMWWTDLWSDQLCEWLRPFMKLAFFLSHTESSFTCTTSNILILYY
jgi:hypothetical protein